MIPPFLAGFGGLSQILPVIAGIITAILAAVGIGVAVDQADGGSSDRISPITAPANAISKTEAEDIALKAAGLTRDQVTRFERTELDRDNRRTVWEVEFNVGATEYDYEVDATTGAVTKSERDLF